MATNNSTLYLMSYNNYYNRIVKREATLDDYPISADYVPLVCNFNPADGIDTEHVMNVPYIANTPEADYLVVVGEDGEINSRWFIVNATRTRGGQYRLSLHRDLIADFYDAVVSSPTYIERGTLTVDSPFIYNSENMLFNQIKTSETLLKDATQTPWVVAYVAKNYPETAGWVSTPTAAIDTPYEMDKSELKTDYYSYLLGAPNFYVEVNANITNNYSSYVINNNGTVNPVAGAKTITTLDGFATSTSAAKSLKDNYEQYEGTFEELFPSMAGITFEPELTNKLLNMAGKVIKDTATNTYFTFDAEYFEDFSRIAIPRNSAAYDAAIDMLESIPGYVVNENNNLAVGMWLQPYLTGVHISNVRAITGAEVGLTVPTAATRQQLRDAPWDMLAMPLLSVPFVLDGVLHHTSQDVVKNVAAAIAEKNPDGVYDIQLLPFAPCVEFWDLENGYFDLDNLSENTHYSLLKSSSGSSDTIYSIAFWCNKSSFNPVIPFTPIINPTNAVEFKVANECDKYRLVSPNYSGAFEFSATKNGGIIGFEGNCSYKPFQPYIHINPIFSGLYGRDFNDNRGLICGGNFSMPSTRDKWEEYQIQNKSYKESFYRQVENMETTYDIQREQAKAAAGVGVATAGISGATAGAMTGSIGGPVGAVVGGVAGAAVGSISSGVGMAQDLKYAQELQKEAMSYTMDQWNLSLQNIKALPNTLSNVGAFDINYKYFPFLEYYTSTDAEKEALRQKIKYNGMAVNAIGTLSDYQGGFVQGQLIRLEGVIEDYHCAAAIANEIHKGVYI